MLVLLFVLVLTVVFGIRNFGVDPCAYVEVGSCAVFGVGTAVDVVVVVVRVNGRVVDVARVTVYIIACAYTTTTCINADTDTDTNVSGSIITSHNVNNIKHYKDKR